MLLRLLSYKRKLYSQVEGNFTEIFCLQGLGNSEKMAMIAVILDESQAVLFWFKNKIIHLLSILNRTLVMPKISKLKANGGILAALVYNTSKWTIFELENVLSNSD